ncbi:MAG: hypothetical protein K2P37_08390 [Oscillospiraceae bacterium]|nr:hypothetical protein [Oscillospiraceae bacterium]
MNYTENYHLPQWEETDRIMRTDFNQMCADMEAGLKSADTGIAEAKAKAAELPYVMGSYVGTGQNMEITVGFKPSFILIYQHCYYDSADYSGNCLVIASELIHSRRIYVTEQGFRLDMWNDQYRYPMINMKDMQYEYVAFR